MRPINIRWMIRRDLPEVLAIEAETFVSPWGEKDFLHALRERNTIGMVAENRSGTVVGFMIYELHRETLRVTNFVVHPRFRRLGVGRQMIAKLVGKLSSQRRTTIDLHVRETNLAGQLFCRSQGFQAYAVCRKHFDDTGEDAYSMAFELDYARKEGVTS